MFSKCEKEFLERLASLYKETGKTEFDSTDYFCVPDHDVAIRKLVQKGYLIEKNDVVGTISINFDAIS